MYNLLFFRIFPNVCLKVYSNGRQTHICHFQVGSLYFVPVMSSLISSSSVLLGWFRTCRRVIGRDVYVTPNFNTMFLVRFRIRFHLIDRL